MQRVLNLILAVSLAGSLQCSSSSPDEDTQAYLSEIELNDISTFETITGIVRIGGEVINRGDQPLKRVLVKIHFLNADNEPILERDYTPISSSWIPFTGDDPLEPGGSRKFSYRVNDAPEEWSRRVRVEVLECEL